jgi:hypothetical protein
VASKRREAHRADGLKVDPRRLGCRSYLLDERCRAGDIAGKEKDDGADVESDGKVTERSGLTAKPGPPLGEHLAGIVIPEM